MTSLAWRAVLAVTLMVLFYALAIAAAALLASLGILLFWGMAQGHGSSVMILIIAAGCVAAAGVILWSVMPRWDRFTPPGPEITAAEHPELFAEIARVAKTTGQPEPAHVYLVYDVNAFVTQRGGIMGLGSKRVMGIGLPLMRALQIDELRAVLAHEMGHFYGGDTKLGPWVYKTRNALGRTVINLMRVGNTAAEGSGTAGLLFAIIRAPFRWFFIGFMRISQAVSRAQEYSADAVAVRAEGPRALVDGLKKTHGAHLAHSIYMRSEVGPLLDHGKVPELGDGFMRYLQTEQMVKLLDGVVEDELTAAKPDPYDSHPPLRERIAAALALPAPTREPDARPAISLVRDAATTEIRALETMCKASFERIGWADTPPIWIATWRTELQGNRDVLSTLPALSFPTDLRDIYSIAMRQLGRGAGNAPENFIRAWYMQMVGIGLALQLVDAGFTVTAEPGVPFRFTRDDVTVEIFEDVRKRIHGALSADEWKARLDTVGLTDRKLADRALGPTR